jgi:hypothetical protein
MGVPSCCVVEPDVKFHPSKCDKATGFDHGPFVPVVLDGLRRDRPVRWSSRDPLAARFTVPIAMCVMRYLCRPLWLT